jgi:hypothetical protein
MNIFVNFSLLITLASSLIFLIAFVIYNKDILKGNTRPNIISWCLFVLVTLINSTSYISMTGDVIKSALAFTDLFTCVVITCLIIFKGYYSKLNIVEILVIIFSAVSLCAWVLLRSATFANLFLQPAYVLAFVPTYLSVYKSPSAERALPWFMWAFCFVLSIIIVVVRWVGAWEDLTYYILAFLLHSGLGLLALRGKRHK